MTLAHQQGHAQHFLQILDLAGQRRLGQMEFLGCAPDAAVAHGLHEIAQVADVDAVREHVLRLSDAVEICLAGISKSIKQYYWVRLSFVRRSGNDMERTVGAFRSAERSGGNGCVLKCN